MNKKELRKKVKELLIFKDDEGSYHLFGEFRIQNNNDFFVVTHEIDSYFEKKQFTNLQSAVAFVVFTKNKKTKEVLKIQELDQTLFGLNVSIEQHTRLITKTESLEKKDIYIAKLYEEKLKKQKAMQELTEYIRASRYYQSKRYQEITV